MVEVAAGLLKNLVGRVYNLPNFCSCEIRSLHLILQVVLKHLNELFPF